MQQLLLAQPVCYTPSMTAVVGSLAAPILMHTWS